MKITITHEFETDDREYCGGCRFQDTDYCTNYKQKLTIDMERNVCSDLLRCPACFAAEVKPERAKQLLKIMVECFIIDGSRYLTKEETQEIIKICSEIPALPKEENG